MGVRKAFYEVRRFIRMNPKYLENCLLADELEVSPNMAEEVSPEIVDAISTLRRWVYRRCDDGWRSLTYVPWSVEDYGVKWRWGSGPEDVAYGPVSNPLTLDWKITSRMAS